MKNPARSSGRAAFASFNFPNSLICPAASSSHSTRRSTTSTPQRLLPAGDTARIPRSGTASFRPTPSEARDRRCVRRVASPRSWRCRCRGREVGRAGRGSSSSVPPCAFWSTSFFISLASCRAMTALIAATVTSPRMPASSSQLSKVDPTCRFLLVMTTSPSIVAARAPDHPCRRLGPIPPRSPSESAPWWRWWSRSP
jgi:hypothetical protein